MARSEIQEIPVKHKKKHFEGDQAQGRPPRGAALQPSSLEMLRPDWTWSPVSITSFPPALLQQVLPEPSEGFSLRQSQNPRQGLPPALQGAMLVSASHSLAGIFPCSPHLPPQPLWIHPPPGKPPARGDAQPHQPHGARGRGGFAAASPQTASKPDVRNGKLSLWGHGGPESAVRAAKRGRSTRTGPPATASVLLPRRELTSFALRAARALAMTRSYLTMRA